VKSKFRQTLSRVLKGKQRTKSGHYRSVKDGDLINPMPLVDFLDGVGEIMRLPARVPVAEAKAEQQAIAEAAGRSQLASRTKIVVLLAVVAIMAYGVTSGGEEAAPTTVPPQVLGTWMTADPRYAGRTFDLGSGFIVFKNGDRADDQTAHEISAVHTTSQGDSTQVIVSYLEAGATYELSFKYSGTPRPGIRFNHQEELVWYRVAADAQKAPAVR
jgi:hypothetical protein